MSSGPAREISPDGHGLTQNVTTGRRKAFFSVAAPPPPSQNGDMLTVGVVGLRLLSLMLVIAVLGACAAPVRTRPVPVAIGHEEAGLASWYGHPYHGRRTASGEVYDMGQMTAAHRTMPFGTWVLVTNRNTGRSVEVRINDRGPFEKGRIIDLSYAAAQQLGAVGPGVIPVRLRVIATATRMSWVGGFVDEGRASATPR
jgi:rare lipoprotein A (peptidoglycan hydrolase)